MQSSRTAERCPTRLRRTTRARRANRPRSAASSSSAKTYSTVASTLSVACGRFLTVSACAVPRARLLSTGINTVYIDVRPIIHTRTRNNTRYPAFVADSRGSSHIESLYFQTFVEYRRESGLATRPPNRRSRRVGQPRRVGLVTPARRTPNSIGRHSHRPLGRHARSVCRWRSDGTGRRPTGRSPRRSPDP